MQRFWLAFVLSGMACIAAYAFQRPWLGLILKLVPVLLLIYWVLRSASAGRFRSAIAVGLSVSLIGDAFLALPEFDAFILGLLSFLLAHIAYIYAFVSDTQRPALFALGLAAAIAGGLIGFLSMRGQMGALLVPVWVYASVLATMLWRALARFDVRNINASAALGALGALAFVASDALLASQRFVWPEASLQPTVLALYWLGQAGIAGAAVKYSNIAIKCPVN